MNITIYQPKFSIQTSRKIFPQMRANLPNQSQSFTKTKNNPLKINLHSLPVKDPSLEKAQYFIPKNNCFIKKKDFPLKFSLASLVAGQHSIR